MSLTLSSYCPSLERVKACPPDQAGRGNKKICLKLMTLRSRDRKTMIFNLMNMMIAFRKKIK